MERDEDSLDVSKIDTLKLKEAIGWMKKLKIDATNVRSLQAIRQKLKDHIASSRHETDTSSQMVGATGTLSKTYYHTSESLTATQDSVGNMRQHRSTEKNKYSSSLLLPREISKQLKQNDTDALEYGKIDDLSFGEAVDWIRKLNIEAKHVSSLEDIRLKLKEHFSDRQRNLEAITETTTENERQERDEMITNRRNRFREKDRSERGSEEEYFKERHKTSEALLTTHDDGYKQKESDENMIVGRASKMFEKEERHKGDSWIFPQIVEKRGLQADFETENIEKSSDSLPLASRNRQGSLESIPQEDSDEAEIDSLSLMEIKRKAKSARIEIKGVKSVAEARCLLKKHLVKGQKKRREVIEQLSHLAMDDSDQRNELLAVYKSTYDVFRSLRGKPFMEELAKFLKEDNIDTMLQHLKSEIDTLLTKGSKSPVLILGQTGAGKSSFINLLLGFDLLPTHVLSTTNTICEIRFNESNPDLYEEVYHFESKKIVKRRSECKDLQDMIKNRVQMPTSSEFQRPCCKVELLLPRCVEILSKTGIVLVDSPGIADTDEMTNKTLGYSLDATAFIFILDTSDAGGVAPERIGDLLHKVQRNAFKDSSLYRPQCAIFVCNKWDQVKSQEKAAVWTEISTKLRESWKDMQPDQMFPLSTRDAIEINKKEGDVVLGNMYNIMLKMISLSGVGRLISLHKAAWMLDTRIRRGLIITTNLLCQTKMSTEKRMEFRKKTNNELSSFEKDVQNYFKVLRDDTKGHIAKCIRQVKEHLRDTNRRAEICRLPQSLFVSANDWKTISYEIKSVLLQRIRKEIGNWDKKSNEFQRLGENVRNSLQKKFPKFDDELLKILSKSLGPGNEDGKKSIIEVSDFFMENIQHVGHRNEISFGGIFSFLKSHLNEAFRDAFKLFEDNKFEREFSRAMVLQKEDIIKRFTGSAFEWIIHEPQLRRLLSEEIDILHSYINAHEIRILEEAKSGRSLMNKPKEDPSDLKSAKQKFEKLRDDLLYISQVCFAPNDFNIKNDFKEFSLQETVAKGTFTSFERIKLQNGKDTYFYQTRCYLPFDRKNYKEFLKMKEILQQRIRGDGQNTVLQASHFVRVLISENTFAVCPLFDATNEVCPLSVFLQRNTCTLSTKKKLTLQMASGLQYLEQLDMVHFDMSYDTVMVMSSAQCDATIKFCTLTYSQYGNFDIGEKRDDVFKLSHFHPSFLTNESKYIHEHDMFSFGLIQLMMFFNKDLFSPEREHPNDTIDTISRLVALSLKKRNELAQMDTDNEIKQSVVACIVCDLDATSWIESFSARFKENIYSRPLLCNPDVLV